MSENDFVCTVCGLPKNELTPSNSQLLANLKLFRCGECTKGKKEPRWAIMLAARTMGHEFVRPWVLNHRYVGEDIKLKEIV